MNAGLSLLRFSTAGSVDDGKSTFIGRLLLDSNNIYDDTLAALRKTSEKKEGKGSLALALLTDGLKAEQEQGITIDVAYRYFSTPTRRFILADSPGHEQYTRNMATGASTADLTIVLIDATKGVLVQTKRHATIASLLGVPRLLIAVNKMDAVGFSEERFEEIRADFLEFAKKLTVKEITIVPVSALEGDNLVHRSQKMNWYRGTTVIDYLTSVYIDGDKNRIDLRFPVQGMVKRRDQKRAYMGTVLSGVVRAGDEVEVLPSRRRSTVIAVERFPGRGGEAPLPEAATGEAVALVLADEIDCGRGSMIVRPHNLPLITNQFDALVVWFSERPQRAGVPYLIMHQAREGKVVFDTTHYLLDVNTLHRTEPRLLQMNDIARVSVTTTVPLFLDPYQKNRSTGNFIVIDPEDFSTVAAGMVVDKGAATARTELKPADHLHVDSSALSPELRSSRLGYRALTVWMTGLSGSGKSYLSRSVEVELFERGQVVYRLDGDAIRLGIGRGLGFTDPERRENIRRVAEVAKLMNAAGVTVLVSLISPRSADRAMAAEIIGAERFFEVFVSTPLEVCESRDTHGLYKKARAGEIENFTGISSPYEAPTKAFALDASDVAKHPERVATIVDEVLRRSALERR